MLEWADPWLGAWPGAALLRSSATAYLFVNAAHILGICLLVGAILPLDLRLIGFFPSTPLPVLGPFLTRAAAVGAVLAILAGLWLFTVRPGHYLANMAFLAKMAVLLLALVNIILQHRRPAFRVALQGGEIQWRVRISATVSALCWLGALLAGRWIGFL
jgi:hypothetical protein